MKYYFQLQYQILNRQLREFGLHPIVAVILLPLGFILFSYLLFYKTMYAPYIYAAFAITCFGSLSEVQRNDFLKSCFPQQIYTQVRLLENTFCVLPFLLFLLFKAQFIIAILLWILAIVFAYFQFRNRGAYSIPTPFSKQPFEFAVGFRKTWGFILVAYFLTYMAIQVGNFELGLFSIFLLWGVSLSYYSTPESIFFAWIFALSPSQFIVRKFGVGLLHFTLLCLPTSLILSYFFLEQLGLVLLAQVICSIYLLSIILAKYATFPKQNSLPEVLLLTISFLFPPLLLFTLPYFYKRAVKQLKVILQ